MTQNDIIMVRYNGSSWELQIGFIAPAVDIFISKRNMDQTSLLISALIMGIGAGGGGGSGRKRAARICKMQAAAASADLIVSVRYLLSALGSTETVTIATRLPPVERQFRQLNER